MAYRSSHPSWQPPYTPLSPSPHASWGDATLHSLDEPLSPSLLESADEHDDENQLHALMAAATPLSSSTTIAESSHATMGVDAGDTRATLVAPDSASSSSPPHASRGAKRLPSHGGKSLPSSRADHDSDTEVVDSDMHTRRSRNAQKSVPAPRASKQTSSGADNAKHTAAAAAQKHPRSGAKSVPRTIDASTEPNAHSSARRSGKSVPHSAPKQCNSDMASPSAPVLAQKSPTSNSKKRRRVNFLVEDDEDDIADNTQSISHGASNHRSGAPPSKRVATKRAISDARDNQDVHQVAQPASIVADGEPHTSSVVTDSIVSVECAPSAPPPLNGVDTNATSRASSARGPVARRLTMMSPFTVLSMRDEACIMPASQHPSNMMASRVVFSPSRSFVSQLDSMLQTNHDLSTASTNTLANLFQQYCQASDLFSDEDIFVGQIIGAGDASSSNNAAAPPLERCLFRIPDGFYEFSPLQDCVRNALSSLGLSADAKSAINNAQSSSVFMSILKWVSFCASMDDPSAVLSYSGQPTHSRAVETFQRRSFVMKHAVHYLLNVLRDWQRVASVPQTNVGSVVAESNGSAAPSALNEACRLASASTRFFSPSSPSPTNSTASNSSNSRTWDGAMIWRESGESPSNIRASVYPDPMIRHMNMTPSSNPVSDVYAPVSDVYYVASAALPSVGLFMSASDFWMLIASFNGVSRTSMRLESRFVHVVDLRPDFAAIHHHGSTTQEEKDEHLRPSSFLSYFDHLLYMASNAKHARVLTDYEVLLQKKPLHHENDVETDSYDSSLVFAGSPFTPGMGTLLPRTVHDEIWRAYPQQWAPYSSTTSYIVQAKILVI